MNNFNNKKEQKSFLKKFFQPISIILAITGFIYGLGPFILPGKGPHLIPFYEWMWYLGWPLLMLISPFVGVGPGYEMMTGPMVGVFLGILAGYILDRLLRTEAIKNIMAGSTFFLVIVLMVSLGVYGPKVTKPTLPPEDRLIQTGNYTIFIERIGKSSDGKNITVSFSISRGNVAYTKVKDVEIHLVTQNEEKISPNKKIIRDFTSELQFPVIEPPFKMFFIKAKLADEDLNVNKSIFVNQLSKYGY